MASAPLIARVTAAYLAVGVLAFVAWQVTGNEAWVLEFFRVPAALLLVCLAVIEFWLSSLVIRHFAPDDLLRPGWTLIAISAGCQVFGTFFSQMLGVHSRINPVEPMPGGAGAIPVFHHIGLTMGGTFRFALLAAGLHFALRAYRESGLLGRLVWTDWTVLVAFIAFVMRNVADVIVAMRAGKTPDVWEVLGWPVDPLLCLLFLQALLLWRSARRMGTGRIGLCWKAFSIGIILTALGDVGLWATNYGYLPWPWSAVTWYVWLPAAAAFARAPAFQLAVIRDGKAAAGPFLAEFLRFS